MLVTLSGLGATLGVAVTGAIFNELDAQRTVTDVGKLGITVTRDQAQELDGVLAGASGATQTLDKIAGHDTAAVKEARPGGVRRLARHEPEDLGSADPARARSSR